MRPNVNNEENLSARAFVLGRDYPEICEWWREREWKGLPVDALPLNALVIESEGVKLAAIFVWFMESKWAWIDYLVTNPKAPLKKRVGALDLAVGQAKEMAHKAGSLRIMTCLKNENLIELHERHGFRFGESGMTTMVCTLPGGRA